MQRPAVLTVLGILNLLVALAGIVGDLRTLLAEVPQHGPAPAPPAAAQAVPTAGQQTVFLVLMLLGLAATIALAAAGIGLLRKRPWGRKLSLGYASYALLAAPLTLALQYCWVFAPVTQRAAELSPRFGQVVRAEMTTQMAVAVAAALFGLIYPVVLLWCLSRPRVVAALRTGPAAPPVRGGGRSARPSGRRGCGAWDSPSSPCCAARRSASARRSSR